MLVEDQSHTIDFLKRSVGAEAAGSDLIATHASLVVLVGDRAFKLKQAVRYAYLNFSTPERRLDACRAELALNRRTAPTLYLGVRTITREPDGHLTFDGTGQLVDAVVEMRRFSQDDLFDTMAQHDRPTPRHMADLARQIAAFHNGATVSTAHGGVTGMAAVLDINDRALRGTSLVPPETAADFAALFQAALKKHADRLERRREAGKVRRCHGDLILRNICLIDGVPTLFDCLEFDEALATIDVWYDLAFLLMDLWHRDRRKLANIVFNRYLDECDDVDGLPLVPFFMAVRAAVRAHVTAAQALQAEPGAAGSLRAEARAYFDLARSLLEPSDPTLLAIGGFSGSGKSTVAALVAPHLGQAPGARTLNTDRIRKHIHGVQAETRLPPAAYVRSVSERVYRILRQEAADVLRSGYSVVADAAFDRPDQRQAIHQVGNDAAAAFQGVWLEAPVDALLPRIAARRNDPSDATAEVLLAQMQRDCGEITWRRVDASGGPGETRSAILALLKTARRWKRDPSL